jgi:hypothetical protein
MNAKAGLLIPGLFYFRREKITYTKTSLSIVLILIFNLFNIYRKMIMKSSMIKFTAIIIAVVVMAICILYFKSNSSTMEIAGSLNPITQANIASSKLVPIKIKLPKPMFNGTEKDIRVPHLESLTTTRSPFLAPVGTTNVALGKPVFSTDEEPIIGEIEMITDGDKEAADGSFAELGPFAQHVTIDLEAIHEIYVIVIWHFHKEPRVYFDVVVQVAEDADFVTNVRTLFNNDIDNSAGLGVGKDKHYVETNNGKLIDANGVKTRYVRLYSNGNNFSDINHYIEVEVYGKPAKSG